MSIINDALSPSIGTAGVGKKGKGGVDCFSISALIINFIVCYLLTGISFEDNFQCVCALVIGFIDSVWIWKSWFSIRVLIDKFEKRCETVLSSVLFSARDTDFFEIEINRDLLTTAFI